MAEEMTLVGTNALGAKFVVKVPVPKSWSSGIWISADQISGEASNCWCFISGTYDAHSRRTVRPTPQKVRGHEG